MQILASMRLIFSTVLFVFTTFCFAQTQTGKASFYADKFEGKPTASGEKYKHSKLTAAHKSLPFGTVIRVTNLKNNLSVDVTVNDRGPYVEGRVVDLSKSAAEKLEFVNIGLADVKIEVIDAGTGKVSDPARAIDHVVVDEKEFYEFKIDRRYPKGFGLQIGTYQELVNLMRLAENLKSSYQKKVVVQVKILNGVKYYSLILGQFSNREKAETFRDEIRKKFPDAFIVDYEKL